MRTVKLAVALSAVISLSACATVKAKDVKIGYIDVPRILAEYEGYKDARKDLDRTRADREDEFTKRATVLKKLAQDIQEGAKLLSEPKRREKETEYMKKAQELEEWRVTQNKDLQEREEGLIKRLESDVREALKTIGEKGKFSFVVRGDLMLYVEKSSEDLTDAVLETLRKQSKGK
jgi:outer membrane protein